MCKPWLSTSLRGVLRRDTKAPAALMRYQKSVFISKKTKQNIFIHTSVFVSFSSVHTKSFSFLKRIRFDAFSPIIHTKTPETLMKATVCDAFYVTVLKSLRFHLSIPGTEFRAF